MSSLERAWSIGRDDPNATFHHFLAAARAGDGSPPNALELLGPDAPAAATESLVVLGLCALGFGILLLS